MVLSIHLNDLRSKECPRNFPEITRCDILSGKVELYAGKSQIHPSVIDIRIRTYDGYATGPSASSRIEL